jgi:hypothetical protein
MTDEKGTVACYNCLSGKKVRRMCGMIMAGCTLCETYGQGFGRLSAEYRYKEVKIGDEVFTPPAYECVHCQDTKKGRRQIFDKDLINEGCSDRCINMPWVPVACAGCCKEQSDKDYEAAKEKHFASKKKN